MEQILTTPFGRRSMTLAMLQTQEQAGTVEDEIVHKWQVFENIKDGREALGVTDRSLTVLYALLTFHQEITLGGNVIVFPSNEKLTSRAHGISHTTLRRHLACLVAAGLVIRRDSPNGKRYARKGMDGEISEAYGFDLTPIVVRAQEFEELAEEARAEIRAYKLVREKITLCRRDILKLIDLGEDEGVPGEWEAYEAQYYSLIKRILRNSPRQDLEEIYGLLEELRQQISETLRNFVKEHKMAGSESHDGCHIQYQITQSQESDSNGFQLSQGENVENISDSSGRQKCINGYSLSFILETCPDIVQFSRFGISRWSEFIETATLVRSMLGISPSAWEDANRAMGVTEAAVTVAAILQMGGSVRSPGGSLRSLSEKAREDKFSVGALLMALSRQSLKRAVS